MYPKSVYRIVRNVAPSCVAIHYMIIQILCNGLVLHLILCHAYQIEPKVFQYGYYFIFASMFMPLIIAFEARRQICWK